MNLMQKVKGFATSAKRVSGEIAGRAVSAVQKGCAAIAIGGAVLFGTMGSAKADTNEGVAAIVTALNGLKPDMGTVVLAAIGIALIGMGAVAAIVLAKRLMGK